MALPLIHTVSSLDLAALRLLAEALARCIQSGDMITLRGEVGAGKTTFSQAFVQAISPQPVEVTSPTFTLMQSYECVLASEKPETVWHLDLYRLEEPEEAAPLGIEELERHVILMEWPEVIEHTLPANRLDITLYIETSGTRCITFAGNDAWRQRLQLVW